ncbi:hypothetical protein FWF74_00725 [Candidatus Saccharibacteria bacterium]|nr:hypothetical protein [Candidatus Saccharibacteria bacterium]MCL1963303.1 hypothetical protein [Candidatus Saccharibacteria bacterium]
MRRTVNKERGALNGYIIGVVCLACVIVGGVFLLKHFNNQNTNNETNQGELINTDKPDDSDKKDDTNTNTHQPIVDPEPTPTPTPPSLPPNGPSTISNTGPTETSIISLFLIMVAGYMAWNYRLARMATKRAMLEK